MPFSTPTITMTTPTGVPTAVLCASTAGFGGSLVKFFSMVLTVCRVQKLTAFRREVSEVSEVTIWGTH